MENPTLSLSGWRTFRHRDVTRTYNCTPVKETNVQKPVVTEPFGLFDLFRMSSGLSSADRNFQKFGRQVTGGLQNMHIYLDNTVQANHLLEQHISIKRSFKSL